jgi:CCR4-NOT transcription complex subunit 4
VNPSCPSCRAKYKKNNIEFTAPSDSEVAARIQLKRSNMKKSKKKVIDRAALGQMRVLQRNLLYVTNLPLEYAREDVLARPEFFGQYGRVKKIAINNKQPPGAANARGANSASAYVTFANEKGHDAYNAILACDGAMLGGKQLKVNDEKRFCCFSFFLFCRWLLGLPSTALCF